MRKFPTYIDHTPTHLMNSKLIIAQLDDDLYLLGWQHLCKSFYNLALS